MNTDFSIIIPTYNRAELIIPTLDSISEQKYENWECLIIDDGSTDNTGDVIKNICSKDPRFIYVYQENAERSVARNNGIRLAKGNWICFLDSDDLYERNYLFELSQFLEINNFPCMVMSDFSIQNDEKKIIYNVPKIDKVQVADWLIKHPVSPSRVCVHRSILNKYRFRKDICIVEDSVLWISIANSFPILQLKKPLVIYRIHENNSVLKSSGAILKRYFGLKLFFEDPLSSQISTSTKKFIISDAEFRLAEYYALKKKRLKALYYTLKSFYSHFNNEQFKMRLFFVFSLLPGFYVAWKKIKS
jgi:glycosyltransferase involved in cell wall biosynthesis